MDAGSTEHTVHILIIDDEPPVCMLLKHILQTLRPDYEVTTSLVGEIALTHFEQQPFDLVITDYQLPGLNGLEIANRVSKNRPGTPIILISGKPPPDIYEQVKIQGLVGFLSKPFSPVQLVEMVEIALSGQNQ